MNKLLESGQKVRERIYNLAAAEGKLNFADLDMIEETVREVCVEYARSFEYLSFSINEGVTDYNNGYNDCIKDILHRIDQDLLSLKEKNI